MIQTQMTPSGTTLTILIPERYVGKKVQVMVWSEEEATVMEAPKEKRLSDLWGSISQETADRLHEAVKESRASWE